MENASRALLISAGMLIGILILSLAVYLYASFGSTAKQVNEQREEEKLLKFNTQFTSYDGKDNITIYDVATLAGLATENNIYYEFTKRTARTNGNDNYISVMLGSKSIEGAYRNQIDTTELISKELQNSQNEGLPQYNCSVKISLITNRVYLVEFSLKNN